MAEAIDVFGIFCLGATAVLSLWLAFGAWLASRFRAIEQLRAERQALAEWYAAVDDVVWRDDRA